MDLLAQDTIAAIASAPEPSARGIIRISGDQTRAILSKVLRPDRNPSTGADPLSSLRPVHFSSSIDLGAGRRVAVDVLFWPSKRSYTRQPSAEIHSLGSLPILTMILQILFQQGARQATPGEFTLRAYLGGRIDLDQAAGVIAAIDARDEREFRKALEQLAGGLAGPFQEIRNSLLDLLADIEAGLDFVDEDIEFVSATQILNQLHQNERRLSELQIRIARRGDSRRLPRVVLFGRPNAGKSSLFNFLVGQDRALISATRGTTRDYLTARIRFQGREFELVDTAGLEFSLQWNPEGSDGEDSIANQAEIKSNEQFELGELRVFCFDSTDRSSPLVISQNPRVLVVETKCDLPESLATIPDAVRISVQDQKFRDIVLTKVIDKMAAFDQNESSGLYSVDSSCLEAIEEALSSLRQAVNSVQSGDGQEIAATEIRLALDSIGRLVGAVYNEDVLDRLFSRFCIGK